MTAYEDRSPHGCGLSNQGATCYLNSLMQTLYMTPEFRRFVYRNGGAHPMTVELQRLFARLQIGLRPFVDTKALTGSFGWAETDGFEQQDVQELMRVLFEAIDAVSGTALTQLYRGMFTDYTTCLECSDSRSRLDPFYDVSLLVRDISSVEEALARFVAPETMSAAEGNQVMCDNCGRKTDALKGLRFCELPHFLTIQLKRFDYDSRTYRRVKLNHKITFPVELDMSPFIDGAPPGSSVYDLFSVLLHSGGALGGHYQAFVCDAATGQWIRFNDSTVSPISAAELSLGFGGGSEAEPATTTPSSSSKATAKQTTEAQAQAKTMASKRRADSTTSAYMLMYRRRDSMADQRPVSSDDIPANIRAEVEAENEKFAKDREAYRIKRETLTLRVYYGEGPGSFNVQVHRSKLLPEATRIICDSVRQAEPGLPEDLSCVRFRYFNSNAMTPGEAYTDATKSIGQLGFHSNMALLLETKTPGQVFPPIEDTVRLLVMRLVDGGSAFSEPTPVVVPAGSRACDLRPAIAKSLALEAARLRVVRVFVVDDQQEAAALELGDKLVKRDLGLGDGSILYAEEDDGGPSRLLQRFEQEVNVIDVCYNKPESRDYSEHVSFDRRRTLRELKDDIGNAIGLPTAKFRMCNNVLSKRDFPDLSKTLLQAGLFDGCNVAIISGPPPVPGEVKLGAYLYTFDAAEAGVMGNGRFSKLVDLPTREEATVAEVAAMLSGTDEFRSRVGADVDPRNIRIRLKIGPRAGHILSQSRSLKDCLPGVKAGKEVAVQVTKEPDPATFPSGKSFILEVQPFNPDSGELGKKAEVVLDGDAALCELQRSIRGIIGSQQLQQQVFVAKPPRFLQEPDQLRELNWHVDGEALLHQMPLNCTDGDLIIYSTTLPAQARTGRSGAYKERALRIDVTLPPAAPK